MKKIYLTGLSLVLIGLMSGCGMDDLTGDDDSSGGGSSLDGDKVEITTDQQAENTVAVVSLIASSLDSISADDIVYASSSRKAPALSESMDCPNGGTVVTDGDEDSGKIEYNQCNFYGTITDGTIEVDGYGENGVELEMDYSVLTDYGKTTLDLSVKDEWEEFSSYEYYKDEIDGSITVEIFDPKGSYEYEYDDFVVEGKEYYSSGDEKINVDGSVSMKSSYTKDACTNGVYKIETTDELVTSYYENGFSDGTMIINGVTYDFQDDGTVDVEFENGKTTTVSQSASIVCD